MESLGHGLPAHQLEEMIKDMGMDEEIDRTIFQDTFLPELTEAGRSWRTIFRPGTRREGLVCWYAGPGTHREGGDARGRHGEAQRGRVTQSEAQGSRARQSETL